jgi:L-aspartate oxidase
LHVPCIGGRDLDEPDFLVLGGGMAGLGFALRVADLGGVIVATKREETVSNSGLAQGGISSVISSDDSYQLHIEDTLNVGVGLSDRGAVTALVENGPAQIRWLQDLGVDFDREDGSLDLTREGGHSRRRVVHVKDKTGEAVQQVLMRRAAENPNIEIRENLTAVDLVTRRGSCVGATLLDESRNAIIEIRAPLTILATGGIGQAYMKTSNSSIATGDGIAMAWRAGARISDMEFIQFHPTILDAGQSPYFLVSESVRGEEGTLRNSRGEAFMPRYHPLLDLAPRDVVTRAIVEEQRLGQVYLDIRHRGREYLEGRFPAIYAECQEHSVRMESDLIPVSPAAHYTCGGILVNIYGETSISGLIAVGECTCTGVHGANRLASNSTLECLTFSAFAAAKLHEDGAPSGESCLAKVEEIHPEEDDVSILRSQLQRLMWDKAGIIRSEAKLREANEGLEELQGQLPDALNRDAVELRNLIDVSRLVVNSAYTRRESRGTHYMEDHPHRNDKNWLLHVVIQSEAINLETHQ